MKYSQLVAVYDDLSKTTKRLEMTSILAKFIKKIPADDLDPIMLLLQGRVFHKSEDDDLGIGSKLIVHAIAKATGNSDTQVTGIWKKLGDLGEAAAELTKKKKQQSLFSETLTVKKVFSNLRQLPSIEGTKSTDKKINLIAELLTSATPEEASYVVKTVLSELRLGFAESTLRDSIVWAFLYDVSYEDGKINLSAEERKKYDSVVEIVQHAADMTTNLGTCAKIAKEKGIKGLKLTELIVGSPVKVMLYPKAEDIEDAFRIVGKPALLEMKYDGFRVLIHSWVENGKQKIRLFTRRLEDVTKQFPDIVDSVSTISKKSFIIDAEAVGYDKKTGKYLTFQSISQRIKRKYDIEQIAETMPVEVNAFDILLYDDKTVLDLPLRERRKLLEKLIKNIQFKIQVAPGLVTDSVEEAEKFYEKALKQGEEGIMVKSLDSTYNPGKRIGHGVKVKPVLESIDVIVTGAEWGEGKRAGTLSSFDIAVMNDDGNLVSLGKVSSGMKEKGDDLTYSDMTKSLKPHIIEEKGRHITVHPTIVLEVLYSELQPSPTYSSGFALRFPRVVRQRDDKGQDDITKLSEIEALFKQQSKAKQKKK